MMRSSNREFEVDVSILNRKKNINVRTFYVMSEEGSRCIPIVPVVGKRHGSPRSYNMDVRDAVRLATAILDAVTSSRESLFILAGEQDWDSSVDSSHALEEEIVDSANHLSGSIQYYREILEREHDEDDEITQDQIERFDPPSDDTL